MRDWITPTASLGLRKILLLACFLCALSLVAQNKQPPSAPKYDLQAETKLKGTIEEVRLPPKGSEKEIAYLDVTGGICTKWNERESTWRKSGSCPCRGTSQISRSPDHKQVILGRCLRVLRSRD